MARRRRVAFGLVEELDWVIVWLPFVAAVARVAGTCGCWALTTIVSVV